MACKHHSYFRFRHTGSMLLPVGHDIVIHHLVLPFPVPHKSMVHHRYHAAYASTAGFKSICEAMYLGKPILMVPAHIEQNCNAYDAVNSGAGISADDFDISRLISFADTFKPNDGFRQWANHSEFMFLPILLAASASRKRYSQRLYDHLLQPVMRYLLA